MSVQLEVNDEDLFRIRLKCERRHSRRFGLTLQLKDELKGYVIKFAVGMAANGLELSNSSSIQSFEQKLLVQLQ